MLDLSFVIDTLGDFKTAALGGLVIGLVFGAAAQQSRFCLRSSSIELWQGRLGGALGVWMLAFFAALLGTQWLRVSGVLDISSVRQLTTTGTLSGALIGGIVFGVGMALARGCAGRLLVLSATGNLRALVAGLVLTVVAQASLRGILSPLRLELASLQIMSTDWRASLMTLPDWLILGMALAGLTLAVAIAFHAGLRPLAWVCALTVGLAIVAGWAFTSLLATQSFEVIPVKSFSFSGPSADTLMALINNPELTYSFDIGLVPGVFAGSFLAAFATGEFRIEGFEAGVGLPRYLIGAALMGFGSMLAGGCSVGAGMTGCSVLALTALIALASMAVAAGLTDRLLNRRGQVRPSAHDV
ncbi:MAG: YeeE/YedE family protein [Alphaproteobacteria bacterium]